MSSVRPIKSQQQYFVPCDGLSSLESRLAVTDSGAVCKAGKHPRVETVEILTLSDKLRCVFSSALASCARDGYLKSWRCEYSLVCSVSIPANPPPPKVGPRQPESFVKPAGQQRLWRPPGHAFDADRTHVEALDRCKAHVKLLNRAVTGEAAVLP